MKPISFGDGYRLSLIAKNPVGIDRRQVALHLDTEAKKIASAIIAPKKATKNVRAAAVDLVKLADQKD